MNGVQVVATAATWLLMAYYLVYHVGNLVIVWAASRRIAAEVAWPTDLDASEVFANPLTPGVTVIVPAHDEEAGILASVQSLRDLRYPDLEIIVVDDGSTDRTFAVLETQLDLRHRLVETAAPQVEQHGETLGTYASPDGDVLVIRKTSVGRRADAVNAALRIATRPLVCMIDADSVLEPEALLRLAVPFIDDPRVVV